MIFHLKALFNVFHRVIIGLTSHIYHITQVTTEQNKVNENFRESQGIQSDENFSVEVKTQPENAYLSEKLTD